MIDTYDTFLASKRRVSTPVGFDVMPDALNPQLFPFQRDIVRWALMRGRAAIFADCGLGKTPMQLEWAQHVAQFTGGRVLILAPLAVAAQTVREGEKFGIHVTQAMTAEDLREGINITNYERLHYFAGEEFAGVVLDESSILKAFNGTTRKEITEFGRAIPYRLACTATPAPNDLMELTNHAEFLSIMEGKEIVALYFTQDGNSTHNWRLKGHARHDFWRWLASWSVALRSPADLGYTDDTFRLPALNTHQLTVESPQPETTLFPVEALSLQERQQARRESLGNRVQAVADIVNADTEQWVVWCDLNKESDELRHAIPGSVEVRGSDDPEHKIQAMLDFAAGRLRVLITKPSIAGFGMNWQNCCHVAFVGLSDSYEQFYQAVRRCWRFGQTREVECYIVTAEAEGAVVKNIERKEAQSREMMDNIVQHMAGLSLGGAEREEMVYEEAEYRGKGFRLLLGDAVQRIATSMDDIASESVGLTVTSPPFPGMYAYTNSAHDMGNVKSIDEMITQFRYLIPGLLRVTMPGRLCCLHLTQITAMKSREGYIGLQDYRGDIIQAMSDGGWIFHGEVTIDKNPQVQAVRNKERGLLFKSLATDASYMRMALADYVLYFRKPGENPRPIQAGVSSKYGSGQGWITEREWIRWARPVWYSTDWMPKESIEVVLDDKGIPHAVWAGCKDEGIHITDVLNVSQARETDDERHLCPLQLGVIERCIKLWSAPGDLVLDPFTGIGSVGVRSLELGRQFVGTELKRSYYMTAIRYLERAADHQEQPNFLELAEPQEAA